MDFDSLFNAQHAFPVVSEDVGIMSIDTLNRQWTLVLGTADGRLVAIDKTQAAMLIGVMARRTDGKFCVAIEVRGPLLHGMATHLGECEFWHDFNSDQGTRSHELLQAAMVYVHLR